MLSFTSVQNDKLYIISQPFGYQYPLFALNFKTYFLYLYKYLFLRPYLNEKNRLCNPGSMLFYHKSLFHKPSFLSNNFLLKKGFQPLLYPYTMTKTVHYGSEPLREYIVSMEKKSRNIIYRTYYVKTAITSTIFSEIMKSGYGRSPHKESVIMNMRKIPCKFFCDIISR